MDDKTPPYESAGKPQVLREYEFYGGCIRVKISVKNTSGLAILDAAFELESDEKVLHYDRCEPAYAEKNGKIILGNLNPNTDRTIAFYFDPLICAKEGTDINCHVDFKYADGTPDTVHMKTLKIQMVCPIFWTEQDINIGRLKELIEELHFHDSKVYTIPKRADITERLKICRNVIQKHDVRHIKTFKTTDDTTYECWYFGKTKVAKKDLVIKCAISKDTDSIEIFVSGNDPKDITGLLAEIGRNLMKEFEKIGKVQPVFNVVIKNSMVKGSNLLSFCDLNGICGGNVVIEDSFVDGTNVASWMQEDKEKARIKEQKRLEEGRKRENEEAESGERGKAQLEQDRLKRQKEEQDRLRREEQERMEKADLSVNEKKAGFSQIRFLAVALALGLLVLGYWALTPGGSDTSQPLQTTPPPAATIIQTPNVIQTVLQTPVIAQKIITQNQMSEKNRIATIITEKGMIKFELYEKETPITTNNFIELAQKGFYNGLTFHRVEPGFVIQGGDPKGDGTGGSEKTIPLEINATLSHIKGAVGMARSQDRNSASSQFYICLGDAKFLDNNYAVFGQVISGLDIAEKIIKGDKMIKVMIGEQ